MRLVRRAHGAGASNAGPTSLPPLGRAVPRSGCRNPGAIVAASGIAPPVRGRCLAGVLTGTKGHTIKCLCKRGTASVGWRPSATHPGRTRYACIAANALAPYTDNGNGWAQVSLDTMAADQRQPVRALRRGFDDLEKLGLLGRVKRRKPGSWEWETTFSKPVIPTT